MMVSLFALLLVLFPFLFWYGTWFGRRLTNADIERYLNDASKPRRAQHALVQIGERIGRHDPSARRWYPNIIELSTRPVGELRQTAAWIMGQDHQYEPFHFALLNLLQDPEALVRRNAALALSNFGDPACRSELRAMLRPYTIQSASAGPVRYRSKLGDFVNPGTLLARVGGRELRSPIPGEVRSLIQSDGATVQTGDALIELSPDKEHAWEALRALWSVGRREDLDEVQLYTRGVPGLPERLRQQAALTAQAIEERTRPR